MKALTLCVALCLVAGCKDRVAVSMAPDAAAPVTAAPLPEPNPLSGEPLKYRPQQKRVVVEPK